MITVTRYQSGLTLLCMTGALALPYSAHAEASAQTVIKPVWGNPPEARVVETIASDTTRTEASADEQAQSLEYLLLEPEVLAKQAPSAGPNVTPKPASPKADSMFIAAGQVGGHHSHYATTGVMTALPGSKLGNGWVARVFAEEIGYRYKSGAREIDGRATGGSVSFGHQFSHSEGWFGTYAGVAYHHTHLSPDDLTSKARGGKTAAHLQVEGEQHLSRDFKLNANAVVDVSSNTSYWTRLRALYRISDTIFAGPEGVYQGDKDYKSWQGGLAVVGVPVTDQSSVGMDAGVRKTQDVPASGYVGLEFGMDF